MRHIDIIKTQLSSVNTQDRLLDIAKAAGDAIMRIYESNHFGETQKEDESPVTKADIAAHRVLDEALSKISFANADETFSLPVVSEESADSLSARLGESPYWLIDPLDGTKEFISRNGEFTVNIALISGEESLYGVVYVPVTGEYFYGGKGFGATKYKDGEKTQLEPITSRQPYGVMASKSHLNQATSDFIDQLGDVNLVQAGSSLKFCRIAEGVADIYPRMAPTSEWDTAAAHAVLQGIGGEVLQLTGDPLVYSKPDVLNPAFIAYGDTALIERYHPTSSE